MLFGSDSMVLRIMSNVVRIISRDVDLDARRIRNPAISRAFGRGDHCRQEASNPFLTKNGSSSVTLPAPPRSVCGQDCISEHRPQSTACNFSLFEIIGLICEHLAYEVRGHYINCIASQHARTNYALAINRPQDAAEKFGKSDVTIRRAWQRFGPLERQRNP